MAARASLATKIAASRQWRAVAPPCDAILLTAMRILPCCAASLHRAASNDSLGGDAEAASQRTADAAGMTVHDPPAGEPHKANSA